MPDLQASTRRLEIWRCVEAGRGGWAARRGGEGGTEISRNNVCNSHLCESGTGSGPRVAPARFSSGVKAGAGGAVPSGCSPSRKLLRPASQTGVTGEQTATSGVRRQCRAQRRLVTWRRVQLVCRFLAAVIFDFRLLIIFGNMLICVECFLDEDAAPMLSDDSPDLQVDSSG